jgi:hypothetical protein
MINLHDIDYKQHMTLRDDWRTQVRYPNITMCSLNQRVFIELWQTSISLCEFENRINLINSILKNKHSFDIMVSNDISGYVGRATRYRNKGVPMKELTHVHPEEKRSNATDWNELAAFAASI